MTIKVRVSTNEFPIFILLYHLFSWQQPFLCVLQKSYSSKCSNIYRKIPVIESIFNKPRLVTLTKKTWCMYFIVNFFKIIKKTTVKHLRKISGKYPCDCWSKTSLFSPFRIFILSDSISWTFSRDERIYLQTFY